ncbi:hypothetical protein [Natrononativus amylolyticus]|uniref:hypothetical protein n=1 Tax=Natrononativus amylolyticus TaxID=2963434 RepID=UPI0020CBC47C|nr:hypothetical protein [Natrononativus amylolyticus]
MANPIDDRTPLDHLLEEIAHQFSVYLSKGVAADSVFQNIDPDLNINNLDDLLEIHFILSGSLLPRGVDSRPPETPIGIQDFLSLLPQRIRHLRTTTAREIRMFDGEVRGRIDWNETIKQRYYSGSIDDTRFACQLAEETASIPENLVLWELLNSISNSYKTATSIIENHNEIDWFQSWEDDGRLVSYLDDARSNVHLSELDADRQTLGTVSDRTIRNVLESREELYREAAILLQRYRNLMDHDIDPTEAKQLLGRQLLHPAESDTWGKDDTPVFFELYWIYKLLDTYDAAQRNLVTNGTHCIAAWEFQGARYELYHDWNGGNRFDFGESYGDREPDLSFSGEDRYLARTARWLTLRESERKGVFGKSASRKKERRPDFVLLRFDDDTVTDIAIGEVKYTRKASTAANGLEELYRYLLFARASNGNEFPYFVTEVDELDAASVHGFLCVDRVDPSRDPEGPVTILDIDQEFPRPF